MSDNKCPEWLTVGAEVAAVSSARMSLGRVTRATVTKIGKRDVVLDDGQRFTLPRLRRDEGGPWGWTVALLPADDPTVLHVEQEDERKRLIGQAKAACDDFRLGKITALDTILALAPLTGVADEIRALDVTP